MIWVIAAVLIVILLGLDERPENVETTIPAAGLAGEVRIAVLSDLHDNRFGPGMTKLTGPVLAAHPDLVVLAGDIFEGPDKETCAWELIDALAPLPVFYVSGNHDEYYEDMTDLRRRLAEHHVTMLNYESALVNVRGAQVEIAGLSDLEDPVDLSRYDIPRIASAYHSSAYRILLSHRPQWLSVYEQIPCDLIISGHAHGGLWRIPFTNQGIFSPQQGFLPKLTGGVHVLPAGKLLYISRGLAKSSLGVPRLYNRPEVGLIRLMPARKEGIPHEDAAETESL